MSKKSIGLIVISLIAGFLLKSCLSGPIININLGQLAAGLHGDTSSVISKEKPIIEIEKVEIPKTVACGDSFVMSVYYKTLRRIDGNYKLFVHLYTGQRKGWINADRNPMPAASEWMPNEITKMGPIQVFIPEDNPIGTYKIEVGLFKGEKTADGERFVRLAYTNLKGHIIGTIKVVPGKQLTQEQIIQALRRQVPHSSSQDYAVGSVPSLVKLSRDLTRFKTALSETVSISLAKNEYEAAQLVLIPCKKNLGNVKIFFSAPVSDRGEQFDPKNIQFQLVGYVPTGQPDYPTEYVGSWPDPLEQMSDINVVVGEVQPVWIKVYASPSTAAGTYTGQIVVRPENLAELKMPFTITVFDFTLPLPGHLKTAFDLYGGYLSRFYNVKDADYQRVLRQYWEGMLRHRISPIYAGETPPLANTQEGMKIDVPSIDEDLQFCLDRGLTAIGIGPYGGSFDNKWGTEAEIKQIFAQYLAHLEPKGLLDMAYIYAYDEPTIAKGSVVDRICKTIHSVSPRLRTLVTIGPDEHFGQDVDIWCPHIVSYRQQACESEKKKGKEIWWYVSSQRPGVPGFNIDVSGIDNRILFWMNWKYQISGVLYWCIDYWGKEDPWQTAEIFPHQNGNGYLFYPGADGPTDSIRAELIRDGIEDYEYFYQLDQYVRQLAAVMPDSELVRKARELLDLSDLIIDVFDYTKDPDQLIKRREKVGRMIEQIKAALQEKNK